MAAIFCNFVDFNIQAALIARVDRMIAPPMKVRVPGCSPSTSQTQTGPSIDSSNNIKPTSGAGIYLGPRYINAVPQRQTYRYP